MIRIKILYLIVSVCISMGCVSCSKKLVPLKKSEIEQVITAYLICEDCENEELEAVLALGDKARPYLEEVLIYGPPAYTRNYTYYNYQRLFVKIHHWASTNEIEPTTYTAEEMVKKIEQIYKLRAISALEALGGAKSLRFFEKAQQKYSFRESIRVFLDQALQRSKSTVAFDVNN